MVLAMTRAKFADKRPQSKRKLSAEEKAEAERKERRKAVIKYATESLARKVGEHPGYTVGEPHPAHSLTVDDFPTQEDFNK